MARPVLTDADNGWNPPVIARISILALEIVGVLVAGVVIAVLALGWRLTSGPISLDFARGMLQDALAPRDLPITVEIGEPTLTWKGWTRVFDVTVTDVRVSGYDGALDARAPSVEVRLSVSALAEGIAAPVRITVNHPAIKLDDSLTSGDARAAMDDKWVSSILSELASPAGASDRLSYLRSVTFKDATIEGMSPFGGEITLSGLNASLSRHPSVLRINSTAMVKLDGVVTRAALDINYDDTLEKIDGRASLSGLSFTSIARAAPEIQPVLSWSAPLDTAFDFEFGPAWTLRKISGKLSGENGELGLPGLYAEPRHLDFVGFDIAYEAATDQLAISSLNLHEGKIKAVGEIAVRNITKVPTVSMRASTRDFPGDRLKHYWPPDLGIDARNWVLSNLEGGTVPKANVDLEVSFDPSRPNPIVVTRLIGGIDFRDVTGHYFRPLPPATRIDGRAEFDRTKFDIKIDSARLNELWIEKSRVRLVNLDTNQEKAEIDAVVRGPVPSALAILNHETLDLGRLIKLDTKSVTGLAGTRLRFAFPLINTLTLAQVDFAASANLEGVGIPDIAAGQALSDGKLTLELNRDSLRIDGTGLIAGARSRLTMDEVFTRNARIRTRKRLNGIFDDSVIKGLGFPDFATLEGPVIVDVEALDLADGGGEITAVVDLRDARLALPALKWDKPAKSAGRIRFALDTRDGRVRRIRSASLLAADLGVDLSAEFAPDTGTLKSARFDRLVLADSTMTGMLNVAADGRLEVTLTGDRLDIRRFMEEDHSSTSKAGPPILINARFEEIQIGALPPITGAVMNLRDDGAKLSDIQLNGRIGGEPITIGYRVDDDVKFFEIRAENAGNVLRGFDLLDSIKGGQLAITGTTRGVEPRERTSIDLSIGEFGLIEAPVLAQVLNAAFLPGLVDVLQGNGIRFERLTAKIDVTKERAKILDALAFGSSLGISAAGEIDRVARTIDINGMIVPAYGLSRLIDQIPILGRIITGGEKEGLLAAEYLVDGGLDKPTVTVNPLTALTPGFLRALVRATNDPAVANTPPPSSGEGPGR
jgi:hypothetical protein